MPAARLLSLPPLRRLTIIVSIVALNMLALAATDLYLPSVPALPGILGTSLEQAQMTLVAFSIGFAVAQIFFGAAGDIYSRRTVLAFSVLVFVPATVACAIAGDVGSLIAARAVQGAAGAASAALTAPLVRDLFDEERSVHAMSVIGGIDAVIPAFAPILGAWVFVTYGWEWNFWLLAIVAAPAGIAAYFAMPRESRKPAADIVGALLSYAALFRHRAYLGYSLSHSAALGGFLAMVLSSPAFLQIHMGEGPETFILVQIIWVVSFLLTANATGMVVRRIGADRMILAGNALQIAGGALALAYALGAEAPQWWGYALTALPVPVGLGLRGGAGFSRALDMMPSHAARASAFMLFAGMAATAAATAAVAPLIETGLWSGGATVLAMSLIALWLLRLTRAA